MAIAVFEALCNSRNNIRVQIFGTDVSEKIVAKARGGNLSGIYRQRCHLRQASSLFCENRKWRLSNQPQHP